MSVKRAWVICEIREVLAARSDIGAVVALEGHNLGRVTHVAVGSKRFRITVKGPGGHSWGDFGRPNAIHGLSKLVAELDAIPRLARRRRL